MTVRRHDQRENQRTQRPQFAALLGQIRNCETLVVAKPDRLGHDSQDVGATVSY